MMAALPGNGLTMTSCLAAAAVSLLYHLTDILSFNHTRIASIYTEETDNEKLV